MAGPREEVYFEREGDVEKGVKEEEVYLPHVDYTEARNRFSATVLMVVDATLDLSNEATDVGFTFSEMQEKEPTLYYVSAIFLILSAIFRLGVALRPVFVWSEKGVWSPPFKAGWKFKAMYVCSVLWSIVEPITGLLFIKYTLDDTVRKVKYNQSDVADTESAKRALNTRSQAKSMLYVMFVMLFLEDIPEIVIDVIFAVRQRDYSTLFWVTLVLSVVHLARVLSELYFETTHIKHIPVPLRLKASDIAKMLAEKASRCHKYCAITIDESCKDKLDEVVELVSKWIEKSATLGSVE